MQSRLPGLGRRQPPSDADIAACPEAFPLWDPSEPSSPPSCGVCPTSGVERGVALRLAPGRTGKSCGRGVAAGRGRWEASGGTLPGRSRKNAVALRTLIFPLALSQ